MTRYLMLNVTTAEGELLTRFPVEVTADPLEPLGSRAARASILHELEDPARTVQARARAEERELEPIPEDFPVQPVDPNDPNVQSLATCGDCGRSWDDAIPTSWTPAPSARCPFEYFHGPREEEPERAPGRLCECEGGTRVRVLESDGETVCAHCGGRITYVSAFFNGGEWYSAEPLEEGREVGAGQCSDCGSFDAAGEPGRGFILHNVPRSPVLEGAGQWFADCGCCGSRRSVELRQHPSVVV